MKDRAMPKAVYVPFIKRDCADGTCHSPAAEKKTLLVGCRQVRRASDRSRSGTRRWRRHFAAIPNRRRRRELVRLGKSMRSENEEGRRTTVCCDREASMDAKRMAYCQASAVPARPDSQVICCFEHQRLRRVLYLGYREFGHHAAREVQLALFIRKKTDQPIFSRSEVRRKGRL